MFNKSQLKQKIFNIYNNTTSIFLKYKIEFVLIFIHVISFILTIILNLNIKYKMLLLIIATLIPILLIINFIKKSTLFKKFMNLSFSSFILYLTLTIYLVVANNYAQSIINQTFKIEPSYFTSTQIFLTLLFPIEILGISFQIIYLFIGIGIIFVIFFFGFKSTLKIILLMFYLLMTFVSNMILVDKIKKNYVYDIALTFDFRSNHMCKNLKNVDSVIFMNPEKVYVNYKNEDRYKLDNYNIENCQLSK